MDIPTIYSSLAEVFEISEDKFAQAVVFQERFENSSEFSEKLIQTGLAERIKNNGNHSLKVIYYPSTQGTKRVIVNQLIEQADAMSLEYRIDLCNNFNFGKGGKLPGLGSVKPIAGGRIMDRKNWSARLMFNSDGSIKTYVYNQNKTQKYGSVVNSSANSLKLTPGNSFVIKMVLTKSIPFSLIKVYLNNKLIIEHPNLLLGDNSKESSIGTFMFNTFHGGADESWTPKGDSGQEVTGCIKFDDIEIKKLY